MGDFGAFAQDMLGTYGFEMIACAEDQPTAQALINRTQADDLLIIDHYGINDDFLQTISDANRRPVYFVDEDRLDYHQKALALISIRLSGQEMDLERFAVPLFSGAEFLVVNPDFRSVRQHHAEQPITHPVQRVTVFLSGTQGQLDHERRLINMLDRVAPQTHITLITSHLDAHHGWMRQNPQSVFRAQAPTPHMARHLEHTDLLICGGGLLKYEAAFCGIPSAICSLVELQHKDTLEFCARGLAWDLGLAADTTSNHDLEHRLTRILTEQHLREEISERCHLIFREDSTNHLASELVRLSAVQD